MAIRLFRFNIDPPARQRVVTLAGTITGVWQSMFSEIARFIGRWTVVVDDAYDPPSLSPGAVLAASFAIKGVKPGDLLRATHSAAPWQVRVDAVCTAADVVTIRFENLDTVNAHDPPVGKLMIEWVSR